MADDFCFEAQVRLTVSMQIQHADNNDCFDNTQCNR